ncbi:MAG: hypothetical protein ACQESF_05310 [Nanobdellota archaeon]
MGNLSFYLNHKYAGINSLKVKCENDYAKLDFDLYRTTEYDFVCGFLNDYSEDIFDDERLEQILGFVESPCLPVMLFTNSYDYFKAYPGVDKLTLTYTDSKLSDKFSELVLGDVFPGKVTKLHNLAMSHRVPGNTCFFFQAINKGKQIEISYRDSDKSNKYNPYKNPSKHIGFSGVTTIDSIENIFSGYKSIDLDVGVQVADSRW